jgi:hypothetical protein
LLKELANEEFDSLAGASAEHLPRRVVLKDQRDLQVATRLIRSFVNKRVAHWDRRGPRRLPIVSEVDDSIDLVEKALLKYRLILTKASGPLLPTFLYDWKEPFRVPWLP